MAVTVGELEAKLKADVSSFVSGMNSATQAFQSTAKTIQQGSSNMSGLTTQINGVQGAVTKLGSKMNMAFAAIGAGFILPQIFMAGKSAVIDFNQQVDQATVALTNFLGSGSAAKDMIKELQDFAARTPFQFKDLLGTTQSMMAMGVAAEDVLPRMAAIGDAAAAMGGSAETLQRIQRALGQIQAKGRVQGEELLQLAEAGIPAYKYLSTVYGGSTTALMSEMKKGAVDSTTAINALLDGMQQDFGGMMEEQSKTMMGAMSTVMDYVQMTVGAIFRPVFETLRDTFVALSELLSSAAMQNAASSFAKGMADVLGQVKALAGAFATQLKKPFMDFIQTLGNLIKIALNLAAALKPMMTAVIIPLGAAFIVIAQVLMPIVSSLAALAAIISQNQIVMYALAGLLMGKMLTGFLATQKAAGGLTSVATKMMQSFGATGKAVAFQFANMRDAGMSMGASIKGSMMSASFSVKALGVAIKTVMIELLPLVIAFVVIGKAMQAFSDRNKDANERTKELTGSIKEQTDAILAQENALSALASNGLDPLNKALVSTGTEGEQTTNALIALGKSSSDYVQTMRDFKKNTEGSAFALAKQKGFTDEQAKAMANFVKTSDKGTDAQHRATMEFQGFTPAMIAATMNLEQLDDASENTNFATMTQGIIQATIRSNEATQAFYDQAQALVEKKIATGTAMSADEKAIAIYEDFIKRAGEYQATQDQIAKANGLVKQTTISSVAAIQTLIDGMKEGKVEASDFLAALIGVANYSKVSAKQAYYDMSKSLTDFGKSLKDTKGSQDSLVGSGYELLGMIGENSAQIIAMGGSVGDVDAALIQMVDTFYKQGQAAGWSKDKLTGVLQMMGLVAENGDIVLNIDVETARLEKTLKILSGMGGADALAYASISKQLTDLNEQKKRSLDLDLKSLKLAGGTSNSGKEVDKSFSGANIRVRQFAEAIRNQLVIGLDEAKTKLDEAKSAASDFSSAISSALNFSFADAMSSATEKATSAEKTRFEAAKKQAKEEYDIAKTLYDQQSEIAKNQMQLAKDVTEAEKQKLNEYKNMVSGAIKSTLDFGSAIYQSGRSGKFFLRNLGRQAAKAKEFATITKDLVAAGLSPEALRQVIATGTDSGMRIGKALLSGGTFAIGQANDLVRTTGEVADDAGDYSSGRFYQAGLDSATAFAEATKVAYETIVAPVMRDVAENDVAVPFLTALQSRATDASNFATQVKTLVGLGLSPAALTELLSLGMDAGASVAQELIDGGTAAITEANRLTALATGAESIATTLASTLVPKFYQAGIDSAQGLYDGLSAKLKTFDWSIAGLTSSATVADVTKIATGVGVTAPQIAAAVAETPVAAPAPTAAQWANLSVGSSGEFVTRAEEWLRDKKFLKAKYVDGNFDAETKKAVIAYQKTKKNIGDTGTIGPVTAKAMGLIPRAMGGNILRGGSYLVGERGPELFQPSMGGKILNNNDFKASGSSQAGDTYIISINSKIADEKLPDLLVAELRKYNRRSGAIKIQVA